MNQSLTIYKASAGSGKTYTLALQYIKLLLGIRNSGQGKYMLNSTKYCGTRLKSRHRHILAITFTNKATEEMKERIIKELHALTVMPEAGKSDSAPYAAPLCSEFGCSREELAVAASEALNDLLYDYNGFNVSTIDSFFQLVLREFAREVDRQGDFEVELDDKSVVMNGVAMMLDDLNFGNPHNSERMQRWIYEFMLRKISSSEKFNLFQRGSNLFGKLVEFVSKSCNEDYKKHADELEHYMLDGTRIVKFRAMLRSSIDKALESIEKEARNVVASLQSEGYECGQLNRFLIPFIVDSQKRCKPTSARYSSTTLQNILNGTTTHEAKFAKSKMPTQGKGKNKTTLFPSENVGRAIDSFAEAYAEAYGIFSSYQPTINALDELEFLGFALSYIDRFRRENNLILLSDTNDLLGRIISDDDAPFIYERLGVYLHHFLIDEFQDTSQMQWKNLRPLVAEGINNLHDSLIIGDEKQAIYRFRNSDASMLHHSVAEDDFPGKCIIRGGALGENTNYRSAPDMVRFNNCVFERMAARLNAGGFENVVQSLPPTQPEQEQSAYINVAVVEEAQEKNDSKNANSNEALERMARHILRQHESGYRWSDIAVLVRTRIEAARVVEFLRSDYPQISVLSEEALYINNSASVKLIMGMLKLLDQSHDNDTDTSLRSSRSDTMAMISRFDFYMSRGITAPDALHMALGDDVDTTDIKDSLTRIRTTNATSLPSIVDSIVQQRIPAEQRKREMAFICAFQDIVIDYCRKYPDSLHDFVKWYDKFCANKALPASPQLDAIQVMTIHKSKGLEWDCVHLPFVQWTLSKDTQHWFHPIFPGIPKEITPPMILLKTSKDFEINNSPYREEYLEEINGQLTDNLNATYVAFTRAARELIISTNGKYTGEVLIEVLNMSPSDKELADNLHIDTARAFNTDGIMEIGQPTRPDPGKRQKEIAKAERDKKFELYDYEVFERDDTREMVAMPDICSELDRIDDEDPDERLDIVDPVPDDAKGDYLAEMRRAARRGILLHAVMAEMKSRDDLHRALDRVSNAVSLDSETTSEIAGLLEEAVGSRDTRIDRWFDPDATLLSEQSILMPDGSSLRPDRIVIHSDGSVDLVDYKFTSAPRTAHQQQLRNYCLMLRRMGYKQVSGHLWYPLLGLIESENIKS